LKPSTLKRSREGAGKITSDHESLRSAVQQTSDGVILKLYVQPKARKAQIVAMHGDRLKIAVTEPPDKGKANEAVTQLIASVVRTAASNVRLIRGQTSRQKDLVISGLEYETVIATLRTHL
jgi:uncharacterized protein (TIGR00251 family)